MGNLDLTCNNAKDVLIQTIKSAGGSVKPEQISIENRGVPHEPVNLPKGKMGVYTFFLNEQCLKIGKTNSKTRFKNHHYNPTSTDSNLAKSLLKEHTGIHIPCESLNKENIGAWIKKNTKRIDVLLDESLGVFVLNFLEAYLQLRYKPKYEGFKSQRN